MEKVIGIWRELHSAFGIQLHMEEMIAEGDKVAVRYVERGTFKGAFRGNQLTGKFTNSSPWMLRHQGR